jgi:hypothetical protein
MPDPGIPAPASQTVVSVKKAPVIRVDRLWPARKASESGSGAHTPDLGICSPFSHSDAFLRMVQRYPVCTVDGAGMPVSSTLVFLSLFRAG